MPITAMCVYRNSWPQVLLDLQQIMKESKLHEDLLKFTTKLTTDILDECRTTREVQTLLLPIDIDDWRKVRCFSACAALIPQVTPPASRQLPNDTNDRQRAWPARTTISHSGFISACSRI